MTDDSSIGTPNVWASLCSISLTELWYREQIPKHTMTRLAKAIKNLSVLIYVQRAFFKSENV